MTTNLANPYNLFCLNELGFSAVWPNDGAALAIGVYGLWENGLFSPAGRIQDLRVDGAGIEMAISEPKLLAGPMQATSKTMKLTQFNTSVAGSGHNSDGTVSGSGNASVKYSASEGESFSVMLNGVSAQSLINAQTVLEKVATAFQSDPNLKWNDRYRIITELWTSTSYFMFGTVSKSSEITVSGSASAVSSFMSGTISAGLAESGSRDGSLQVLANNLPKLVGMKFAAIRELEPLSIDLNAVHYS